MSDVSYQDIQTLFQRQQEQARAAQQTHALEVNAIIDAGREKHGSDRFDEMSATVAEKLGERTAEFMNAARQFDSPVELIEKLTDDPRELERLAKLPTSRMLVEIARIEFPPQSVRPCRDDHRSGLETQIHRLQGSGLEYAAARSAVR